MSIFEVLPTEILLDIGSWLILIDLVPLSETCHRSRDIYQPLVFSEKKKSVIYLPEGISRIFAGYFPIKQFIIRSRANTIYNAGYNCSKLAPFWNLNGEIIRVKKPANKWSDGRHRQDGPAIEYADGSKVWYFEKIPWYFEKKTQIQREYELWRLNIELHREEENIYREKREKEKQKKHIRKLENIQKNYLNKKATTKKEKRKI